MDNSKCNKNTVRDFGYIRGEYYPLDIIKAVFSSGAGDGFDIIQLYLNTRKLYHPQDSSDASRRKLCICGVCCTVIFQIRKLCFDGREEGCTLENGMCVVC